MTNGHDETPQLTELQRVKLENFTLKQMALQGQLQNISYERAVFLQSVVQEHPGWGWRDPDGLVKEEEEKRPFVVGREAEESHPEAAMPPDAVSGNRKPKSFPSTK